MILATFREIAASATGGETMAYRPITPIKGPGIAAVSELYDEQQDMRRSQVEAEERSRAADNSRGRRMAWLVGSLLIAILVVATLLAAWPRGAAAPMPSAVSSLATLSGSAAATTAFDGQRYTISFTSPNFTALFVTARTFAEQHGYTVDTPNDGRVAITISGPKGGVAVVYVDGDQTANTPVRIVVDASDLTADGSALR